jgi:23S rRNA (uridine2552-2'-O)-methyltransferase
VRRPRNPYARPDARTRQARAEGYPARSVFKLEEIDRRVGLLRRGQRVLDLGAAPGSWTLYSSGRVGPEGRVVAVDLAEIRQSLGSNVTVLRGDLTTLDAKVLLPHAPFDLVLSDMAPNTSGSKVRDQTRSFELFQAALAIAVRLGKPGSSFVGKLFMGPDFQAAEQATRERYSKVRVLRPQGTRAKSSEVFLVGIGLTPLGEADLERDPQADLERDPQA